MSDACEMIEALEATEALREGVMREAMAAFAPPRGSRGLDVGCGIGSHTLSLAHAVGAGGGVTGVDASDAVLERARLYASAATLEAHVDFVAADMAALPFGDDAFDWLWSADCIGYPCGDPLPALREAARVVRPGGRIAVLAWTSQVVLPGHALLEARLNATSSPYAPYLEGAPGETQFLRLPRWFAEVGLARVGTRTFVGEVRAPLDGCARRGMIALFEMLWGGPQSHAAEADLAEFRRLCRPDSAGFIADLPGYYAFFTYTMIAGVVPTG